MLQYRCLVLDHDDTTVDSTHSVNYPQFRDALTHFRPEITMTEEAYFLYCFDPGFYEMCHTILHYTDSEMAEQLQMWKDYHKNHRPAFFAGMPEVIRQQKAEGGIVCVVSHSTRDVIEAAYDHAVNAAAQKKRPQNTLFLRNEEPFELPEILFVHQKIG